MSATPNTDTDPRDDGVMHGRAVWNGKGNGPPDIEGEGQPDEYGIVRKTRRDARVKPATRKAKREPAASSMTPTDRAVVWFESPPELPERYEPQRGALVSFEAMWHYQRALGSEVGNASGQVLAETTNEVIDEIVAKLEAENGKLRVELAELTAKVSQLDFIVERLKIENRDPPGVPGPMGRDGRDGRDGAQGPVGPKGSRGQRGFEIVGWLINQDDYSVTPQFYDGKTGPTLCLLGLFETYSRETEQTERPCLRPSFRRSQ
jgi:hypothetical protein